MGSLSFIGTATALVRLGAFTVLTDPNFLHRGQRAYLGKGLWSPRLTEPAVLRRSRPRQAVPVHYDDYGVFRSPLSAFLELASRAALPCAVHAVRRGETVPLDSDRFPA